MVPLEAMAAGVPIVASRVDGVTDLVRDGIEGVVCRPGDADDLASAVARVVRGESDWQSLRQRAASPAARRIFRSCNGGRRCTGYIDEVIKE